MHCTHTLPRWRHPLSRTARVRRVFLHSRRLRTVSGVARCLHAGHALVAQMYDKVQRHLCSLRQEGEVAAGTNKRLFDTGVLEAQLFPQLVGQGGGAVRLQVER